MPQPTKNGNSLLGMYKDRPNIVGAAFEHIQGVHDRLDRQTYLLEQLVHKAEIQVEAEEFKLLKASAVADGTGQAQVVLENRTGYEMELVSYSSSCSAAATGELLLWLNAVEPANLIWAQAVTQYYADKFTKGLIIPVNGVIVMQWLSMGAGVTLFGNLNTRRISKQKQSGYQSEIGRGW